jgi:hypothetical protein
MPGFDIYKDAFPHANLTRSQEGVLEVVLHTNGDTLIFNGYTHEEVVELFHQISQDAGNRVVILGGQRLNPWSHIRAHPADHRCRGGKDTRRDQRDRRP